MTELTDLLATARAITQRIASDSHNALAFDSEIARLVELAGSRAQLGALSATLADDARTYLDQHPCAARAYAHIAHQLAHAGDASTQTDTALTLAMVLNRLGEFREVLPLCQDAVARFEKRGDKKNQAQALCESAWANTFIGDLNIARQEIERARATDSSALIQAHCDWVQAYILHDQGQYDDAEVQFKNARDTFQQADLSLNAMRCQRELARTLILAESDGLPLLNQAKQTFLEARAILDATLCDYYLGRQLLGKGQYTQALELLKPCRQTFVESGSEYYAAVCDNDFGICYRHLNLYDLALASLHQARDHFGAQSVRVQVSACDINLGNVCYKLNRYDEARTYYEEAANLAQGQNREARIARIYMNLALVHTKQGRFAQALDLHQRARHIFVATNLAVQVAFCDVNLAAVYRQLGQFDQAVEHLQWAKEVFVKERLYEFVAETTIDLADAHLAQDQYALATKELEEGHALCMEHNLVSFGAVCERLLAQVAGRKNKRTKALALVAKARATFLEHKQHVDAALCDLTAGELYLDWNKPGTAQDYFQRARAILAPGFPDSAWRADYGLGRCEQATQNDSAALSKYLEAIQTIANVRATIGVEQFSNDFFARRRAVYQDALRLALKQGSASTALDIIEASQARTFLALIQQRGWKPGQDQNDTFVAGLSARERQLRNDIESLRQRVAVQTPNEIGEPLRGGGTLAAISAAALDELNALSRAYESVVTQLQLATHGLAGVSAPAPFALDTFRAAANRAYGADWVALDYALQDNQIVCAVISPREVRLEHRKLSAYDQEILEQCAATEPDLRELIYRGTLHGARVSSVGTQYLRHLYPLLIPRQLDAKKLIISPHGGLHNLPFHALIDPQSNTFLIEHHTLVYTPSLHVMQHLLAQPDENRTKDALVFGLSDFGEMMRALPETEKEINALRELFPAGQFFWGSEASREKLYDLNAAGELQRFAILHFATHATLDRSAPHQSRIMLSDMPLNVFDILDLTLDARLVTLSACQTALGKGGQGDELVGLARAFFYAGARALLATLWHVEDSSSTELIRRFYGHWVKKQSPANALRLAQIEMIQAGYPPYQWAATAILGQA